jgi:predicted transcriptional regulator YdeE
MGILKPEIVEKPSYQAVGLTWQGTYEDLGKGGIKTIITVMKERLNEIDNRVNPDILLGLSYHNIPGGFTHYSMVEVSEIGQSPVGMATITVPAMTYVRCEHKKGRDIGQTYMDIASWINSSGHQIYEDTSVTYYDPMPIKHEEYPIDSVLDEEPEFFIMIPIVKG